MKDTNWKTYSAGLGIYAICTGIAALPILSQGLSLEAALELLGAAAFASLLVAIYRGSRLARRYKDSEGVFLQALLGILVCGGLYSLVSDAPRPEVFFTVFLLWAAVGLMHLTPGRVAILFVLATGIFADTFAGTLFVTTTTEAHAEAVYMTVLSTVMACFMCWRAWDYTRVRNEKSRLREENARQAGEIEEAKNRIHTLTVQDMDTIALKYPFFRQELQRCKERADRSGESFSVGLVSIDHFAALSQRFGETAMKQLNREVVQRVAAIVSKMNVEGGGRHPGVGKVGDGLFGVILERTNLRGARICTERLHVAISHQMVRTMAGPLDVTVTVGFAEYYAGESVDELMELVGKSLEKARLQDVELQANAKHTRPDGAPVKLATGAHDMRLLHEKEYGSPLH